MVSLTRLLVDEQIFNCGKVVQKLEDSDHEENKIDDHSEQISKSHRLVILVGHVLQRDEREQQLKKPFVPNPKPQQQVHF